MAPSGHETLGAHPVGSRPELKARLTPAEPWLQHRLPLPGGGNLLQVNRANAGLASLSAQVTPMRSLSGWLACGPARKLRSHGVQARAVLGFLLAAGRLGGSRTLLPRQGMAARNAAGPGPGRGRLVGTGRRATLVQEGVRFLALVLVCRGLVPWPERDQARVAAAGALAVKR